MAKEANVDIATLTGSGILGRVTKNDFLSYVQGSGPRATAASPAPAPSVPSVAFRPGERTKVEPLSVIRRKISEHMVASKRTSAHVHSFFEVDYSVVERIRKEKKEAFLEQQGFV
jgi:2-oxoglutarate dehydrogenase E2 component (dihydrolipoamide succinyltransferase)